MIKDSLMLPSRNIKVVKPSHKLYRTVCIAYNMCLHRRYFKLYDGNILFYYHIFILMEQKLFFGEEKIHFLSCVLFLSFLFKKFFSGIYFRCV